MGAGFCNFHSLGWDVQKPLAPDLLVEQGVDQSSIVGKELEGLFLHCRESIRRTFLAGAVTLLIKVKSHDTKEIHSMKRQISEQNWDDSRSKERSSTCWR